MLYRGRRYINTCFVSVLRQLFKNHAQFPWTSSFLESKIYIDESYPRGERKFPCIICTDVTDGDFFETSFDRNFQEDVYDQDGTIKGSIHGMTIKPVIQISISALTKYDCEIISDYVCSFIQYYAHDKFADAGIEILTATGTAPQPEEYGKNNIYTVNITLNLYAEWQKFVSIDDDIIEKVTVPNIGILYQNEQGQEQVQNETDAVVIPTEDIP